MFDGHVLIEKNSDLVRGDVWWRSFGRDYYATSELRGDSGYYRPVAVLANAIDRRLYRERASGYHLTNAILHAATSCVLGPALIALGAPAAVAWTTAVLFAVHPAHAESVAFVSGRVDVLAALGTFTALAPSGRRGGAGGGVSVSRIVRISPRKWPWFCRYAGPRLSRKTRTRRLCSVSSEAPASGRTLFAAVGVAGLVALGLRRAALGAWLPVTARGARVATGPLLVWQSMLFAVAALYAPRWRLSLEPDATGLAPAWLAAGWGVAAALWFGAWRFDRPARSALWRCGLAGGLSLLPVLNFFPQEPPRRSDISTSHPFLARACRCAARGRMAARRRRPIAAAGELRQ